MKPPSQSVTRPDTGTSELPFPPGEVPPRKVAWLHPLQLLRTTYQSILSSAGTGLLDRRDVQASLPVIYDGGYPTVTWLGPGRPDVGGPADPENAGSVRAALLRLRRWLKWIPSERPPDGPQAPAQPLPEYLESAALKDHSIWIDYVADIGDSWDATYATLSTLARSEVRFRGLNENGEQSSAAADTAKETSRPEPHSPLPRAHVLVLGGDQVYPTPSRDAYRSRTRSAFMAAFPESAAPLTQPSLLAVPGNHDWYDGLTAFTREFCRGGSIGAWAPVQGRSYFAVKLHANWWLFGIDIALDSRVDAAQERYFIDVLASAQVPITADGKPVPPVTQRIILCTAKPVWIDDPYRTTAAYRNLAEFADLIRTHGGETTVILSGDTHHYSHYASACPAGSHDSESDEHMFVVGGGGAYLSPTHHLRPVTLKVTPEPRDPVFTAAAASAPAGPELAWRQQSEAWNHQQEERRRRDASRRFVLSPLTYPSQAASRRMVRGALWTAFRAENVAFTLMVGLLYQAFASLWSTVGGAPVALDTGTFAATLGKLLEHPPWAALSFGALLVALCASVAVRATVGLRGFRIAWGAAHGVMHLFASLWLLGWVLRSGRNAPGLFAALVPSQWQSTQIDFTAWHIIYVLIAAPLGTTLFAIYLVLSDKLFGWHSNEAFMVQSIVNYRSFLRMRLDTNGTLTIYPIGLREIPLRWRARAFNAGDPVNTHNPSMYEPGDGTLAPVLIEAPIVINP